MTLRQALKSQYEKDLEKAPLNHINQNGLLLTLDKTEQLYKGIDNQKKEWIAALQKTGIPIFSHSCINCSSPNFIKIFQHDTEIKCRKCGKSQIVAITSTSQQIQKTLGELDG